MVRANSRAPFGSAARKAHSRAAMVATRSTLPAAPPGYPPLPRVAGTKVGFLTDSYGDRGVSITEVSGVPTLRDINSSNLWSLVRTADRRFDIEAIVNYSKPAGTYGGARVDGSVHALAGSGVTTSDWPTRIDYALARLSAGDILYEDMGKNSVNVNATLADIQTAMEVLRTKCLAAKVWLVVQSQAAFRDPASTPGGWNVVAGAGDWTASGAAYLKLLALNDWLKNTFSKLPGVAAYIDTTALDGLYVSPRQQLRYAYPDPFHLGPFGNWQRAVAGGAVATLRTLVQPPAPRLQSSPANVFAAKSLAGTNGSKNTITPPITGSIASNMRVIGAAGDTIVCSKGTNSDGEETQIIAVTVGGTGAAIRSISFNLGTSSIAVSSFNAALAANGQTPFVAAARLTADTVAASNIINVSAITGAVVAGQGVRGPGIPAGAIIQPFGTGGTTGVGGTGTYAISANATATATGAAIRMDGDWIEFSMRCSTDSAAMWTPGDEANRPSDTNNPAGGLKMVLTDSGGSTILWQDTDESGTPNSANRLRIVCEIPPLATHIQALAGLTHHYLATGANIGTTGVLTSDKVRIEKVSDPRIRFNIVN